MNEIVEVEVAGFSLTLRASAVRKVTTKFVSLVEMVFITSTSAIRSALFLASVKSNAPNNMTLIEGGLALPV